MCKFISWIEKDNVVYYLNDNCLKDKKGRQLKKHISKEFYNDIKGHGAIRYYYDMPYNIGINKEYTGINIIQYPEEIIKDIKACKFRDIGFNVDFLAKSARKKYEAIEQSAWKKYEAIEQPALEKYEAIKQKTFWDLFQDNKNRIKELRD